MKKYLGSTHPTCMLALGRQCSAGTKRTWTFILSIICIRENQNFGTVLILTPIISSKNLQSLSSLIKLKNALNLSGIKLPCFIQDC